MLESFCRQFVLTGSEDPLRTDWKSLRLQRYLLYHHAELPVTQVNFAEKTITLIGFFVDSAEPFLTDAQLLHRLIESSSSGEELARKTLSLGGRWAIVAEFPGEDVVLNDVSGLRQVFYSDATSSQHFCASQATIA